MLIFLNHNNINIKKKLYSYSTFHTKEQVYSVLYKNTVIAHYSNYSVDKNKDKNKKKKN